jgi:deoxyribose-phosphate aldolase
MKSLQEILRLTDAYVEKLPDPPVPLIKPVGAEIASWIDHTLLKPEATGEQIKKLCQEAVQYKFATVCINPVFVSLARGMLMKTGIGISAVISFPLGADLPEDKVYAARRAIGNGASEIDMVINIGALKGQSYGLALNDVKFVAEETHAHDARLKVILETALLTRYEKILACLLAQAAGADFVKTSTGFGPHGATVEDVKLMRRVVGSDMGVKAAGGIRTCKDALAMIGAGANRLGSSAGVAILQESIRENQ